MNFEQQTKYLVGTQDLDKYQREILQIKIEHIVKSALLEQRFDFVQELRRSGDDKSAELVREFNNEI